MQIHDLRPDLRMLVDDRGAQAYLLRRGHAASFRRFADLPADAACFGHGR